ncbi:thymidylate synthase [Vibrio caribbeanicus]|uniref:thymidylate synthase n=1 Tax=Vibrio caribbeanicus TaxID=701175 RepID=UPI0022842D53|nr:thymidylate synthase [Vibrio caribbeanicus]MCY9845810.1 thymidylate synthase [Vibrio caribbeanicus]
MNISSEIEKPIQENKNIINIREDSVDRLVRSSILNIINNGSRVRVRAGDALQCYGVNYILENPRNRVHSLRPEALKYLCNEFIAYFKGSLNAEEGLAKASKFWSTLVDNDGNINSNYGYYVFHEKVHGYHSQLDWVIKTLEKNSDSRRAIININQNYHKSDTKDFPCTVAIMFYIKNEKLFCEVSSRSTDVITGLPYDMGFFSFVHELVYCILKEKNYPDIILGETIMKTTFTQIYDKTFNKAVDILKIREPDINYIMPVLTDHVSLLHDIYNEESKTNFVKWVYEHAK